MEDFIKGLEVLSDKVDRILSLVTPSHADKKDLYKALAQAQGDYSDVAYSGVNDYYKDRYATLTDLVRATRPALTKHGLSVYQSIEQDEHGTNFLKTVLAHVSGQTLDSTIRLLPLKNTVSHIGSYLAHMRRLCYASLVGIMVHDADDDDGNINMMQHMAEVSKGTKPNYAPEKQSKFKRISKDQLETLDRAMKDYKDLWHDIRDAYNIEHLADLPEEKFEFVLGQIRKNVAKRDGLL